MLEYALRYVAFSRAYPTVMVTVLPRFTLLPTFGDMAVTFLMDLLPIFLTITFSPKSLRA